jgi:hypothetical protein
VEETHTTFVSLLCLLPAFSFRKSIDASDDPIGLEPTDNNPSAQTVELEPTGITNDLVVAPPVPFFTLNPTRQDKTRHGKTRQDKTRQDKTRQDMT